MSREQGVECYIYKRTESEEKEGSVDRLAEKPVIPLTSIPQLTGEICGHASIVASTSRK